MLLVAVAGAAGARARLAVAAAGPRDRAARLVGTVVAGADPAGQRCCWPSAVDAAGSPASAGAPAVRPWHQLDLPWVPGLDLRFHLGVDGISYPLVVLTALLTLLCCALHAVAGAGRRPRPAAGRAAAGRRGRHPRHLPRPRPGAVLRLLRGRAAADVRGHRRLGRRRTGGARPASSSLYTLFGSVLLLVGVFVVVAAAGTADLVALTGGARRCRRGTQLAAFVLLALAFAVKSPLWPLHTWLPDAHTEAPTVGSVDPGRRAAEDGHLRPDPGRGRRGARRAPAGPRRCSACSPSPRSSSAALVCLAQTELKRLIAYSSRRAHGLRAARHRHADRHRLPGRADRQHRPRRHHRPAVLPGRRDQGPGPHRRPRPSSAGCARPRPRLAGLLGVRRDRLARPARAGRLLGRGVRGGRRRSARRSALDHARRAGRASAGRSPPRTSCGCCAGSPTARPRPARRPRVGRRAGRRRAGRLGAAGACWRSCVGLVPALVLGSPPARSRRCIGRGRR